MNVKKIVLKLMLIVAAIFALGTIIKTETLDLFVIIFCAFIFWMMVKG